MPNIEYFNEDCIAGMKRYPDKHFSLAICDPPYGGAGAMDTNTGQRFVGLFERYRSEGSVASAEEIKVDRTGGTWAKKYGTEINSWDVAPPDEYFKELFRVSLNQIIWGGQLLCFTSHSMFCCLAQADDIQRVFDGDVRVCLDKL